MVDVRSPAEFSHAHIPHALNIPLLSDEERKEVGTLYKQVGQQEAIRLGVTFVSPKLPGYMQTIRALQPKGIIRVYCWRGGMRSGFMSWFFQFTEAAAASLHGGYKSYRRWAHKILEASYQFSVVGGLTGSGKTEYLHKLALKGEQVIDLEAIACHRGSAFGLVSPQPSNEQFENELAMQLAQLDCSKPIWIEDESRMIGSCMIPRPVFEKMQQAPLYELQVPRELRLKRIVEMYGTSKKEALITAVQKICKKLGSQKTHLIISSIQEGAIEKAASLLLEYYDTAYFFSMSRNPRKSDVLID